MLFAERGWRVFELSRRDVSVTGDGLQVTGEIIHVTCDVTDEASCKAAIAQVLKQTDTIDVVISNAGYGISGPIEFTQIKDAERQMDVNFMGAVRFTQAVLPQLRQQRRGRIIYTSSVAAILAVPYQSFYSASKAAINAFALALANEMSAPVSPMRGISPRPEKRSIRTPTKPSRRWNAMNAAACNRFKWRSSSTASLPVAARDRNISADSVIACYASWSDCCRNAWLTGSSLRCIHRPRRSRSK